MTTLKHYNWNHQIDFEDGSITHLFIENPVTLRKYIAELIQQIKGEEGDFVLSKDTKEIPISKNLAIIPDIVNIILEEKKINTQINKDLLHVSQSSSHQQASFTIISAIEKYAETLLEDCCYSIDFEDIDESKIIKMLNFHITTDFEDTASTLLEYLNTTHDILNISNFVILNASTYFSKEELTILEAEITSEKHNILFIDRFNHYDLKNSIIIDSDNCELY